MINVDWNSGFGQWIGAGYDFSIQYWAAHNLLFNVNNLFIDPTYYFVAYRNLPIMAALFIPFLIFPFNLVLLAGLCSQFLGMLLSVLSDVQIF